MAATTEVDTKVTTESDDPKKRELGDSVGNSTKDPEIHEETTKVVKIEEFSDDEAFVSPEEKKKQSTGRC